MLDSNISTYIDKDGNVQEVGSFDSSKFVTLDTAQTISGSKTFNDSLKVASTTDISTYLTLSPVSISLQDVATSKGLTVGVDSIESVSMYSQGGTQILKFQTENMSVGDTATLTLPAKSGTLALTSDLPDASKFLTTDTEQVITATKAFKSLSSFMGLSGEGITFVNRNDSVKLQIENNSQGTGNNTIILPRKDGTLATLDDVLTTVKSILLAAFPVGTTVMSPTDPAEFIGGSWQKESAGKFFRSYFSETDEITDGGSITHRHNFRIASPFWYGTQVGDNYEGSNVKFGAYKYSTGTYAGNTGTLGGSETSYYKVKRNTAIQNNLMDVDTAVKYSTGDTDTTSTLPPYKNRIFWTRIN